MYTAEMATAFKAIVPPKNFGVVLLENDDFITIQIDPKELLAVPEEDLEVVVKYINDVKFALESLGAIVMILREALED
jgi:hypothetical protein